MPHLKIVGWDKLQHYKDRNPPWIKLHRDVLTSKSWVMLNNDGRALMMALMVMACECDGALIPMDEEYVCRKAYFKSVDFKPLIKNGFLEIVADDTECNEMLASASSSVSVSYSLSASDSSLGKGGAGGKTKTTLDTLSVLDISDWLAKKRQAGKYVHHDEHEVLEKFKNYCLSKNKQYADYPAALRGAFDWDKCQPEQGNHRIAGKSDDYFTTIMKSTHRALEE